MIPEDGLIAVANGHGTLTANGDYTLTPFSTAARVAPSVLPPVRFSASKMN